MSLFAKSLNQLFPKRYWLRKRRAELPAEAVYFPMQGIFWVLLLLFSAGYLFLGEGLIFYRHPVLHFNPNTQIGSAAFKLIQAKLTNGPGGPGDYISNTDTDLLLIQTSASQFEDIVAYTRWLASPNDHQLVAVFVADTIPGQKWQELAQRNFEVRNHRAIIPANWIAKLDIYQGGTSSKGPTLHLLDLRTYQAKRETWEWVSAINYVSDSLTEQMCYWCSACDTLPAQKTHFIKRRIAPTDATFYSRLRLKARRRGISK